MSKNIRTFDDIGNDDNESGHDSDGEQPPQQRQQDFYVGSGQAVQGPRGSLNQNDLLQRVAASARANGVEPLTPEQIAQQGDDIVAVHLHVWKNGFSIDNGPLRPFDTPESEEFFQQITRGQIPPEIQSQYRGKQIDLKLNRKSTEYEPPKMKAFEGAGVRLGNVVPTIVSADSSSTSQDAQPRSKEEAETNLISAKKELNLDSSQPTTNIQIRLPNNQRIIGTFNQSHTLSSVRKFICTSHPELVYQPFQLMTSYPTKVIDDENVSLKDANLLNSVIIIKPQV